MPEQVVLQIAIPVPLYQTFDYLAPPNYDLNRLIAGLLVQVSFAHRTLIGVVLKVTDSSPCAKLKTVDKIIDGQPCLNQDVLKLCKWLSAYYQAPIGECLQLALPKLLRKKATPKLPDLAISQDTLSQHAKKLNPEQHKAFNAITQNITGFHTHLLYGVTGSGKTEVYMQLIDKVLARDQQILVLIPEISLTPQTLKRFAERFAVTVIAQHSAMSDAERYKSWQLTRTDQAKILISTRSGIFNQFASLGMIIVDEEHDLSFKQQNQVRYSARDLAVIRAREHDIPLILGSATPSLESLHNAWHKNYILYQLEGRANNASLPRYRIEDIRGKVKTDGMFTDYTFNKIKQTIKDGLQVLIFINRRGFAPTLYCTSCGHIATCARCDANLTLHKNPQRLICHHCGSTQIPQKSCPKCSAEQLLMLGYGTQKVEQYLRNLLSDTKIMRIDRDSTRKRKAWDKLYQDINQNEPCIMIGTQMLAKGHHFPNVALVVIFDADHGLLNTDFRAHEYLAQLLTQVAGRAGRDKHKGEVIIQTSQPDNLMLNNLITKGYLAACHDFLQDRIQARFPPLTAMALLRAKSSDANRALSFLTTVSNMIKHEKIEKLGPLAAPMEKRAGFYRAQLVLQADNKRQLQRFLRELVPKINKLKKKGDVKWSVDVDPVSML